MDNKLKIFQGATKKPNDTDARVEGAGSKTSPWYAKGLCFECTGCGQCCTGAPGFIWVTEEEIEAIAHFLQLTIEEVARRYLRRVKGRLSLIELPKHMIAFF